MDLQIVNWRHFPYGLKTFSYVELGRGWKAGKEARKVDWDHGIKRLSCLVVNGGDLQSRLLKGTRE